jgi:23S rRNA pseudouridine1911/1915/1917 synthase
MYGRPRELGLGRQFLHARRLAFTHPITGEAVDVSSPLPPDLEAALATLRES